MERYVFDNKRGYGLQAYYESHEDFSAENGAMLRLVHIAEGSGIIKINGETIIFSAPALFCLNELDKVELQQAVKLSAYAVYFHPSIINDSLQFDTIRNENSELSVTDYRDYFLITPFVERSRNNTAYIEIGPITSKKVTQIFESIKEELTCMKSEYWSCRARTFLLEILFLIQNMITDLKDNGNIELPEASEDTSSIILYLHTNYDRKITIEELTDIFHINRTTLSAKFREATGLSIMEYLVKYRIKVAAAILRDTMLPVSEVLNRVGFKDSVHFSRMFRKHTGYTPSAYREKYIMNYFQDR